MEIRNGKFRESIWIRNKKITSPSFTRKTDALTWKAMMRTQREKQLALGEEYKVQSKRSFADFSLEWLEGKIKPSCKPSTYKDYEQGLRCHLNPVLGTTLLKDIRIKDADQVVISLTKKGNNPKRIGDMLTLLKQILNEAERREEIIKNHLRHYKGPKVPQLQFKFWSSSEISQFLLHCQTNPFYPFFVTAFYTGMRKGEIAALTWECVDFEKNLITVKGTLDKFGHRESTKTGRIRYVPMNDFLKGILLQHFKNRSEASKYVFLSNGMPIDTNHLYRVFGRIQKQAGIANRIRMHDTRHTFASQFMMKGGALYDLSQILGHTDTKMTQRYAHLSPQHLSMATKHLQFGMEGELSRDFTPILPQSNVSEDLRSDVVLMRSCN